jgi:hypothetical protein
LCRGMAPDRKALVLTRNTFDNRTPMFDHRSPVSAQRLP